MAQSAGAGNLLLQALSTTCSARAACQVHGSSVACLANNTAHTILLCLPVLRAGHPLTCLQHRIRRSMCLGQVSRCSTLPSAANTRQEHRGSTIVHVRTCLLLNHHKVIDTLTDCIQVSMQVSCMTDWTTVAPRRPVLVCYATCAVLTLLVPKPHVGLVDFVDSFCAPELLRGWAVPGPGLFMPKACFSCSLEMNAAGEQGTTVYRTHHDHDTLLQAHQAWRLMQHAVLLLLILQHAVRSPAWVG
jgi:hypothetical protein